MKTALALVHHANQYLITNGYDNREGIDAVIGSVSEGRGIAAVLELHGRLRVPFNLHISGTLLEAIAWHQPEFLESVRFLIAAGLVELVGSCYGQNIMRFFGLDYNRAQLNEELALLETHLGIPPKSVTVFWPPERVWDTRVMPGVLRDANLLNSGYKYVILDDRLLLAREDPSMPREHYDTTGAWNGDLFRMHEIDGGLGLIAFPIATRLRRSIPPKDEADWNQVQSELEGLLVHSRQEPDASLLGVYADDLEKVAGIGEWGPEGPERYARFLEWVAAANAWIEPVKLSEWAAGRKAAGRRTIERGTFQELAHEFDAGESYEKWYFAPDWAPYRGYFKWAEERVRELASDDAASSLIELAEKQLLVGNWETAWHTPSSGPHGDADQHGHASPWARALTSHVRHAAVTAEAAHWMTHNGHRAEAIHVDMDKDGENDLVLRNQRLYGLITSRWGGRIVALYGWSSDRGAMVVGNPCDDWNWMEELNRFMEVPRNHPGAFADAGYENDHYRAQLLTPGDGEARIRLVNVEKNSRAKGLVKEYALTPAGSSISVRYELPPRLDRLSIEFGLSPDYLHLLRNGSGGVRQIDSDDGARGFAAGSAEVWVRTVDGKAAWENPLQPAFGHGLMLRLGSSDRKFTLELGATVSAHAPDPRAEAALEPVLL